MFVSFTDWEFDGNIDNAVEGIKGFWPEMQKYGAVNTRCTVTGENTLRTIYQLINGRTFGLTINTSTKAIIRLYLRFAEPSSLTIL